MQLTQQPQNPPPHHEKVWQEEIAREGLLGYTDIPEATRA